MKGQRRGMGAAIDVRTDGEIQSDKPDWMGSDGLSNMSHRPIPGRGEAASVSRILSARTQQEMLLPFCTCRLTAEPTGPDPIAGSAHRVNSVRQTIATRRARHAADREPLPRPRQ